MVINIANEEKQSQDDTSDIEIEKSLFSGQFGHKKILINPKLLNEK